MTSDLSHEVKRAGWFILACIAALTVFAMPLPAFAKARVFEVELPRGGKLDVRSRPVKNAEIIGHLRNGDQVSLDTSECFDAATGNKSNQPLKSKNIWCEVIIEGDLIGNARAKYFESMNGTKSET